MTNQRFLTQQDAAYLARLAEDNLRLRDVVFHRAEDLVSLLSAAILLPDNIDPTGYVGLNSMVAYRIVGEEEIRSAAIVFPLDKTNPTLMNWVLTPFAMALIGIRAFDIVATPLFDGRTEMVEILGVNSMHRIAA